MHALLYQNATALEGALIEKKTLINEVSRLKTTNDEDLHKYKLVTPDDLIFNFLPENIIFYMPSINLFISLFYIENFRFHHFHYFSKHKTLLDGVLKLLNKTFFLR